MNKLALLALSLGLFTFAGCAMQPEGDGDESAVQSDESAQKKGTRADRIEACKQACYAKYTPCTGWSNPFGRKSGSELTEIDAPTPGLATKDVAAACNPALNPDLGPNPFALAQCDIDCAKVQ